MSTTTRHRLAVARRLLLVGGGAGALVWATTVGPLAAPDPQQPSDTAVTAAPGGPANGEVTEEAPPVSRALLACVGADPDGTDGTDDTDEGAGTGTTLVATAPTSLAPPGGEGSGPGQIDLVTGAGAAGVPGPTTAGQLVETSWVEGPVPLGVDAEGRPAPGVAAGQAELTTAAGGRGLTLTSCSAPRPELWLTAGDDAPGRAEHLVLVNPGDNPVQVDVAVHDVDGPREQDGVTALVVPAGGRVIENVDAVAPGAQAPLLHVVARTGAVGGAVVDVAREGTTDLGRDLSAPLPTPAHDLLLPAAPAEGRPTTLRVAAPERDAVVELRGLGEEGPVAVDDPVIRVRAGQVLDVPLTAADGLLGLRLRSDHPVTATLQTRIPPSGEEPVDVEDATDAPDDTGATTAPPDDAAATTAPPRDTDGAATTEAPDDAATTTAPPTARDEPLRRPAGELSWTPAAVPVLTPLTVVVPDPDTLGLPEAGAELTVAALDAGAVEVTVLDRDGRDRTETLQVGNDAATRLPVPEGTAAIWVTGTGGVAASVEVTGADRFGPYLTTATAVPAPWLSPLPVAVPQRP